MIPDEKFNQIENELDLLEREERVTILWACESGSRAWGFESRNSDYDVRFIYLRQTKEYLRVSDYRDVIEKPISDDLDISGWDLPKALSLFRKSNPPLLEWLQSPIVYRKNDYFHSKITSLVPKYFSPIGCMYHYMSMADRNRRSYLDKKEIKLKRYFYMLRPVLACMWIHEGFGTPPIEFGKLLDRLLPDGAIRKEIDILKERKREGDEVEVAPPIPIISNFIISQMEKFTEVTKETQFTKAWDPLDELFRNILIRINGNRIEQAAGGDPAVAGLTLLRPRIRGASQGTRSQRTSAHTLAEKLKFDESARFVKIGPVNHDKIVNSEVIAACKRFRVKELHLFGSALSGRLAESQDIDLLVVFERDGYAGAFDQFMGFKETMEQILGKPVDLITYKTFRNPLFQEEVDRTKELIYGA